METHKYFCLALSPSLSLSWQLSLSLSLSLSLFFFVFLFFLFINFFAYTKLVQKITMMYHYINQLQLQVSLDGVT